MCRRFEISRLVKKLRRLKPKVASKISNHRLHCTCRNGEDNILNNCHAEHDTTRSSGMDLTSQKSAKETCPAICLRFSQRFVTSRK